jgi:hypothetical protein
MSNISNQHDAHLYVQANESGNASMLIAPPVSCWEAGRWELTRASIRRSSTSSMHRPKTSPPNDDRRC